MIMIMIMIIPENYPQEQDSLQSSNVSICPGLILEGILPSLCTWLLDYK